MNVQNYVILNIADWYIILSPSRGLVIYVSLEGDPLFVFGIHIIVKDCKLKSTGMAQRKIHAGFHLPKV